MDRSKQAPDRRQESSLTEDIRWGIGNGIFMAGFFSVFAVISLLIHGITPLSHLAAALVSAVLFYFVSGLLGGAILGILRPLTRNVLGAMLAAVPVMFVVGTAAWVVAEGSPLHWSRDSWQEVTFFALILGPFFGAFQWLGSRARRNRTRAG